MKNYEVLTGVERRIFLLRGTKVMLSVHLAELYGVETRMLNQAVKRNKDRFPRDFMFVLTTKEALTLVSQNVIPHRKFFGGALPYAFTEQGVAMLSSVVNSRRAVQVNIAIMRAFVRLREILLTHKGLADKLKQLEKRVVAQGEDIHSIFEAIRRIMTVQEKPKREIGFHAR